MDIFVIFLRLGTTAFGGPAAHIALMEEEFVRRRLWLKHEEFLDLLGATNLIPGPNSTEMAIHVGYKMRGYAGLLTAGTAFILPAFLLVWVMAWFYVEYGKLPALQNIFHAVKPVVLAVIAQAIWNLAKSALKDRWLVFLAAIALVMYLIWGNELLILPLVAAMNVILHAKPGKGPGLSAALILLFPGLRAFGAGQSPTEVFSYFTKIGAVLFGSGYVLIAFLQSDLVAERQWLTQQQLVDAIAVGQFTPGPVFTTATFVGYLEAGHLGAIAATLGIFAPAFFFVALSAPLIPKLRGWCWTSPVLDGLNAASLSLMAGAATVLARDSFSPYGAIVFVLSFTVLLRYKINSVWLILTAAGLGTLLQTFVLPS